MQRMSASLRKGRQKAGTRTPRIQAVVIQEEDEAMYEYAAAIGRTLV